MGHIVGVGGKGGENNKIIKDKAERGRDQRHKEEGARRWNNYRGPNSALTSTSTAGGWRGE